MPLWLACGDDTTTDDSVPTTTETDTDTDTDTDTVPPLSRLTSKADLYVVHESRNIESYTEETLAAMCEDNDDLIVTGGCYTSEPSNNMDFMGTRPLNATDTTKKAGWGCDYQADNFARPGEAWAVCLRVE